MKNIYLAQPTYMNTSTVYFPYAIGALASYAWTFADIAEAFTLKGVFFLREKTDKILAELEAPFLVGFSCYMWNFEYNKFLAKKIKQKFPDCIIAFGGPQVPGDAALMDACPFIDILMHYEGEVTFRDLLRALANGAPLGQVNNISYRAPEGVVSTPFRVAEEFNFPSPYESGFCDKLMAENPDIEFVPLLETNRGCPNRCAYCSWGTVNARVRLFPLSRVYYDLEWVSRHKMEFLGSADANFGMFPRDEQITDKIIELNEKYGYPKKFQVSYSKDTGNRVFAITEKLNRKGMDKGVTLSFQTMSKDAQKNIGRSNMDIEYYKSLLEKYSKAGIPTYTDLILGLPGETVQSFRDGIEELLEYGQHTSLFVHLCEWLPQAEMGDAAYMEKFRVSFTRIPINQPHMSRNENDEVQEYSRVVTSTYSMSEAEWKQATLFGSCVLCFHHLGLLQCVGLYLYHEKGVRYTDFYETLLAFLMRDETSVFPVIARRLDAVVRDGAAVVMFDDRFGNIAWPFEEYAFLCAVAESDAFYDKIAPCVKRFFDDEAVYDELIAYQKFIIKSVDTAHKEFFGNYDWKTYFAALLMNSRAPLQRRRVHYTVDDENVTRTLPEYAKRVLWFGRRGGKNLYTTEIKEVLDGDDAP